MKNLIDHGITNDDNVFNTNAKNGNVRRLKALLRLTIRNLKKTQAPLKDDGFYSTDSTGCYMFVPKR